MEFRDRRREMLFAAALAIASALMLALPSPARSPYPQGSSLRAVGEILAVDDSLVKRIGPIKEGDQLLSLRVLTGPFKGREFESSNHLIGKLELDKLFAPGDRALVILDLNADRSDVAYANVLDHFRLASLVLLATCFIALLVVFGRWTGLKTALCFAFSAVAIFKVLLPAMLVGIHPVFATLVVVSVLAAVISFLIGGFTRKGLVAFLGSMLGILSTALLAVVVTRILKLNGAGIPYSETLLYTGYQHLDLAAIFSSGIFLASSGAVLDLAMDIAAAMDEFAFHKPDIGRGSLLKSGFSIGRMVIGTQTTTLLFAYSSGFSGLLLTFIAQGAPLANVLNMVYVSSELANILVGSLGLVLVAPFTAIVGALLLSKPRAASAGAKEAHLTLS